MRARTAYVQCRLQGRLRGWNRRNWDWLAHHDVCGGPPLELGAGGLPQQMRLNLAGWQVVRRCRE